MSVGKRHKKTAFKLHNNLLQKKRLVISASVIVLLLVSSLITCLILINNKKHEPILAPVDFNALQEARAITVDNTSYDAQALARNGKNDEAVSLYDDAIKSSDDAYSKSTLTLNKATIYFNNGDYEKALSVAKEALSIQETDNVDQFIAQIYTKKGDNQNAIVYYKKAVALVDKSQPMAEANIKYYNLMITNLGG